MKRTIFAGAIILLAACTTTKEPARQDFYFREIQPGERVQGKHNTCSRHNEISHKDGSCFFCGKFENQPNH